MVLNTNITFKTNLSILSNTITKFISPHRHARKTTTPVRLLDILQLRFTQVTQLSDFYFSKKELLWIFIYNKFFLELTSAPWLRALYKKVSALSRFPYHEQFVSIFNWVMNKLSCYKSSGYSVLVITTLTINNLHNS